MNILPSMPWKSPANRTKVGAMINSPNKLDRAHLQHVTKTSGSRSAIESIRPLHYRQMTLRILHLHTWPHRQSHPQ